MMKIYFKINLQLKFTSKICHENLLPKFTTKIFYENLLRKFTIGVGVGVRC